MRKAEQNIATPIRDRAVCALMERGADRQSGVIRTVDTGKGLFDPAYPAILKTHLDTMWVKR